MLLRVVIQIGACSACLLLLFSQGFAAIAEANARSAEGDLIWRTTENSGLNCLYLRLRMLGHRPSYVDMLESARQAGTPVSMASLQQIAGQFGISASVRKCAPNELTSEQLPLVAFMDSTRSPTGEFVLLLGVTSRICSVIDGATVEVRQIDTDEFRRRWSGYVLTCEDDTFAFASTSSVAALSGVAVVAYWWFRLRPRSSAGQPA